MLNEFEKWVKDYRRAFGAAPSPAKKLVWEDGYRAGSESRWIPVGEQMPENGRTVMFYVRGRFIEMGEHLSAGVWNSERSDPNGDSITYDDISEQVTHWCALPDPPKEKPE